MEFPATETFDEITDVNSMISDLVFRGDININLAGQRILVYDYEGKDLEMTTSDTQDGAQPEDMIGLALDMINWESTVLADCFGDPDAPAKILDLVAQIRKIIIDYPL